MEIILAESLWQRARAAERAGESDVVRHLERLVEDLAAAPGLRPAAERTDATVALALSPRRGGLLVTLLDDRERPVQMFPLSVDTLADHLALYGATIAHLADPESLHAFEALDYGKRVAHNEAAEALSELLEPVLKLELEAARRLFSLTYLLVVTLGDAR